MDDKFDNAGKILKANNLKRILYIGNSSSRTTSWQRAEALRRIGYTVEIVDPYLDLAEHLSGRFRSAFHFRTGYRLLQRHTLNWVSNRVAKFSPVDAIWVDSGELFGLGCVLRMRESGVPVVLFNHDDPTGSRDGRRFDSLRYAIPAYTLCAVCREPNIAEFRARGAGNVVLFTRGYDEIEHAPYEIENDIPIQFHSEVAFIGTWMRHEDRDKFLLDLITAGVPLSIWGDRWEKSKYWLQLRPYYRGGSLSGRQYVAAIQGAKICLGLLSKGNRDLSTSRSTEIPFIGGLLCAERTIEHQRMYREWDEAIFWESSIECARICLNLLKDDRLRKDIRINGRMRVLEMNVGNESMCQRLLEHAMK